MTVTCACGIAYEETPAGRWRHRIILGHTPARPKGTGGAA